MKEDGKITIIFHCNAAPFDDIGVLFPRVRFF